MRKRIQRQNNFKFTRRGLNPSVEFTGGMFAASVKASRSIS